jgi:hypothetical protein
MIDDRVKDAFLCNAFSHLSEKQISKYSVERRRKGNGGKDEAGEIMSEIYSPLTL